MTSKPIKDPDKLNEIIERLSSENSQNRKCIETAEAIIRRRAPSADGLSLAGAVETILNERDQNLDRINYYREELKKILTMLLAGKHEDAKKEVNIFLFKNKK